MGVTIVKDLPKGKYTIHVAEEAFKKKVKSGATVTFSVVDELQAITSLDDLKTYFEAIVNEEKAMTSNSDMKATEESASFDSATSGASDTASHSETNK